MKKITLATICTCLSVCVLAYTMTKEQLVHLLKNGKPEMRSVVIGFTARPFKYNGVDVIECYNKKGVLRYLPNSPMMELTVVNKKGRRKMFYFDTILFADSTQNSIIGCESRLLYIYKKIDLEDIDRLELQEDVMNWEYSK
ncbi:MAG: hypothetical protein JSS82_12085 [Bacteroidetes bacterium]|nr:hypothetical protein [Bacteroidota bacterium]